MLNSTFFDNQRSVCEIRLKFDDRKRVRAFPLAGDYWHVSFPSISPPLRASQCQHTLAKSSACTCVEVSWSMSITDLYSTES